MEKLGERYFGRMTDGNGLKPGIISHGPALTRQGQNSDKEFFGTDVADVTGKSRGFFLARSRWSLERAGDARER